MRPLNKGDVPKINNVDVQMTDYKQWRAYLIERIGYYCAYCNIPLSHSLNVEHVVAKVPQQGQVAGAALDWDNLLLACGPCNNAKKNEAVDLARHYLPEHNNTLLPFKIQVHPDNPNAAIVVPSDALNEAQLEKARNTIMMMGLDEIDERKKVVDIRWKKRRNVLTLVDVSYEMYLKIKEYSPETLNLAAKWVARSAAEAVFFLIWFDIFKNEPLVISELIDSANIPGTALECFENDTYNFLNRNTDNDIDPI